MIEEDSTPLFMLITGSLTAAFAYYRMKYRKFMKEEVT
jgi:hypothetical protein